MARRGKSRRAGSDAPLPPVRRETLLIPGFPLDMRQLPQFARRLLDLLGLRWMTPEIRLVDDREMAALNMEFLGIPGPTNVLAFPGEDDGTEGLVVLNMDALRRESFLYGQDPLEHLTRLLAHAFLHLAGLDHGPEMDAATDMAVSRVGALSRAV
jgi:probable rRNA maturation factor